MSLLLTNDEEQYILDKLRSDSWHIAESIKDKIETDRQRKERFLNCNHIEAHYRGEKTCCAKCGGYFKPGQGESWIISKKRNIKNSVEDSGPVEKAVAVP